MPAFEYEHLVLFLKLETLDEEEDRGNINGVGSSGTKTSKEEPKDLKGGKDNLKREASGETYALEQTLKLIEYVVQEFSS